MPELRLLHHHHLPIQGHVHPLQCIIDRPWDARAGCMQHTCSPQSAKAGSKKNREGSVHVHTFTYKSSTKKKKGSSRIRCITCTGTHSTVHYAQYNTRAAAARAMVNSSTVAVHVQYSTYGTRTVHSTYGTGPVVATMRLPSPTVQRQPQCR